LVQRITNLLITKPLLHARENINTDLESVEFLKILDTEMTKFKNNPILLNEISYHFKQFISNKLLSCPRSQGKYSSEA
jgi:hypothetical protein